MCNACMISPVTDIIENNFNKMLSILLDFDSLAWVIFVLLTAVHVYANWRSMKALNMETLNQARFHLVAQSYFSSPSGHIMSIFDANQREPVFGSEYGSLYFFPKQKYT